MSEMCREIPFEFHGPSWSQYESMLWSEWRQQYAKTITREQIEHAKMRPVSTKRTRYGMGGMPEGRHTLNF